MKVLERDRHPTNMWSTIQYGTLRTSARNLSIRDSIHGRQKELNFMKFRAVARYQHNILRYTRFCALHGFPVGIHLCINRLWKNERIQPNPFCPKLLVSVCEIFG